MTLFSKRLVAEVRRMPGGRHSFLAQVCADKGTRFRNALEALVASVEPPIAERSTDLLTSLDNRRFFQGYAEVVVAAMVSRGALKVTDIVKPGALLKALDLNGKNLNISVLSFIHKSRPMPDKATVKRLIDSLNRLGGQERMIVAIRRWLPPDFSTEEVRRAVEHWLTDVESGAWSGRYASFIDDERGLNLEFGLTGAKAPNGPRVCSALGPFLAPASLSAVEPRVIHELDTYRLGLHSSSPLLLACVSDQQWPVSRGYLRDFLYGSAKSTEMYRDGDQHGIEFEFSDSYAPALFRDPLYKFLSGVLWIGRDQNDPTRIYTKVFLNPWAKVPIDQTHFSHSSVMGLSRWREKSAIVKWYRLGSERISLV